MTGGKKERKETEKQVCERERSRLCVWEVEERESEKKDEYVVVSVFVCKESFVGVSVCVCVRAGL